MGNFRTPGALDNSNKQTIPFILSFSASPRTLAAALFRESKSVIANV